MLERTVDKCGDVGTLPGNNRFGDEVHEVAVASS